MNKIMIHKFSKYILGLSFVLLAPQVVAQTYTESEVRPEQEKKHKRAWEIGVGGTGMHMTRMSVLDFQKAPVGHEIKVNKRDLLFGGNLYIARELNPYFYLDLQGTVGYAKDPIGKGKTEDRFLYMGGLGLQWRLGEYFESKYIDPFFRVGANYMYKTFTQLYNGVENYDGSQMNWGFDLDHNKSGADQKQLFPVSFGTGINMWLSNGFGIGLQADYLYMPHKNVANVWQGTARLMWRIGGKSKKPAPEIRHTERVIERIVEKPTIIEKIVPTPVIERDETLCELFNYVFFEFDKATITQESQEVIDRIADILRGDLNRKYLIIGYTDAVGSSNYNLGLSERRAKAVVDALIQRNIPREMLKFRGVGKKVAYVKESAPDNTRRGDRKVTIERVINMDYWNYLK